jgi:predicted small secreted protein
MTSHHQEDRRIRILRTLALSIVGLGAIACSACNTTKGVGKDVEAAGEGLQGVADDTKDAMTD